MKFNSPVTAKSILTSTGAFVVYSLFAIGCFVFTYNTIGYLLVNVKIGSFLLHRFIMIILFLFFVTINIGNIVVSFSTLYRSQEVYFLFTKPVSFANIFAIKFLDNFFYSSATLLFIVFSVLAGYGYYFKLGFIFYPVALLLIILPFMFMAGSLGVIILLVILRLSLRWGLRRVILIIAALYSSSIFAFYFLSSPIVLVEKVFEYYPDINQYFGFLESGYLKLLPNYWIADSLYWLSSGKVAEAIPYIAINLIVTLLVFLFAIFLAKKWYYLTWVASLKLNTDFKLKFRFKYSFFRFENASALNRMNEVLLKREALLFFRDPGQWLHFSVMIFLILVFLTSISSINLMIMKSFDTNLKALVYLIVFLFNVFLIASISLRFIFPLISLEGEALWKIKSSPINHRKYLLKRLGIYFVIILVVSEFIAFFSNLQFPPMLSFIAQVNSFLITTTLVSLNFGMGGIFADFKEKNPIRIASSQGASLTFLITLFYLFFLIALLFFPVYHFFSLNSIKQPVPFWNMIYPSIILFVFCVVGGSLIIKLGLKAFNKDI